MSREQRIERAVELAPGCDDCRARGHYCPGLVTADQGKTHLCFACDAGTPCEGNGSPPVRPAPMGAEIVDREPPTVDRDHGGTVHEPRITPIERIIAGERVRMAPNATMGAEMLGLGTEKREEKTMSAKELKAKVLAEPDTAVADLVKRLGASRAQIYNWRSQARMVVAAGQQRAVNREPGTVNRDHEPRAMVHAPQPAPPARTLWRANLMAGPRKDAFHFRATEEFGEASRIAEELLAGSPGAEMAGANIVGLERLCRLWN